MNIGASDDMDTFGKRLRFNRFKGIQLSEDRVRKLTSSASTERFGAEHLCVKGLDSFDLFTCLFCELALAGKLRRLPSTMTEKGRVLVTMMRKQRHR